MKHYPNYVSALLLGISLILVSPSFSMAAAKYINGNGVHVRSHPGGQILGKLYKGAKVIAKGSTGNYRWTQIEAPADAKVWICKSYVRDGVVTASHLNVRSGPSSHQNVLGSIERGTQVEVVGSARNWLQIKAPQGTSAFVYSAYVNEDKAIAAVKPPVKKPTPVIAPKPKKAKVVSIKKVKPAVVEKLATPIPSIKPAPKPKAINNTASTAPTSAIPKPKINSKPVEKQSKKPADEIKPAVTPTPEKPKEDEKPKKKKPNFFQRLFGRK